MVLFKDNAFSGLSKIKGKNDKKNIVKNVANSFLKYMKMLIQKGRTTLEEQADKLNALI